MTTPRRSRIALLTANSLCHNPRAMKAALALARAGHEVHVLGAWLEPALKARDQRLMEDMPFCFAPVVDVTSSAWRDRAAQLMRRVTRKAAHVAHGMLGLSSALQLGYGTRRLAAEALRRDADLCIAHSEPALHAARALMRRGRRVGVDMEDWFSEDLLPETQRYRPLALLRSLETLLLTRGAFASSTSRALAGALAHDYGCAAPTVIYNAFAWSDRATLDGRREDRGNRQVPSIHWFSTTLGPGRGIEDLVAALPLLRHDVEVHLRGNPVPAFAAWIRSRLPDRWPAKVFFHPLVANDSLLSRIAEHDVGFAGEMTCPRSRDLTVTNKILHYLLAGLAVVASDTAGQREIAAAAPDAISLYPSGDPQALAAALDAILAAPDRLQQMKAAALAAARTTFCWERQEPVLQQAVAHALAGPAARVAAPAHIPG
jgi:glycosyltransferase involved in cell wall biosynthesis